MILGVVNRVHTDGVEAQLLELGDIALAHFGVGDGVGEVGGATRLVVETADVETFITLEEGITFDGNGSNVVAGFEGGSRQDCREERGRSGQSECLHGVGCSIESMRDNERREVLEVEQTSDSNKVKRRDEKKERQEWRVEGIKGKEWEERKKRAGIKGRNRVSNDRLTLGGDQQWQLAGIPFQSVTMAN